MTDHATILRQIFTEARPLVEQALELADKFAGFREFAASNGLDWSQIKALLKAQVQDERADDGKDRVGRILEKADFASAYADMLGLGSNMNENNFSSDITAEAVAKLQARADVVLGQTDDWVQIDPPHDADGVLIEECARPSPEEEGCHERVGCGQPVATGPVPGAIEDPASGQPDAEAGTGGVANGSILEARQETAPVSGDAGESQALAIESASAAGAKDASPIVSPIVSPPQTIAAVVASTTRDAPAASPFPEMPKCLRRIA